MCLGLVIELAQKCCETTKTFCVVNFFFSFFFYRKQIQKSETYPSKESSNTHCAYWCKAMRQGFKFNYKSKTHTQKFFPTCKSFISLSCSAGFETDFLFLTIHESLALYLISSLANKKKVNLNCQSVNLYLRYPESRQFASHFTTTRIEFQEKNHHLYYLLEESHFKVTVKIKPILCH